MKFYMFYRNCCFFLFVFFYWNCGLIEYFDYYFVYCLNCDKIFSNIVSKY